jgi:hypothetical protein
VQPVQKLGAGLVVVIRYGTRDSQLAVLLRPARRGRWYVRKWRANSRRFTNALTIDPSEVLGVADSADRRRANIPADAYA